MFDKNLIKAAFVADEKRLILILEEVFFPSYKNCSIGEIWKTWFDITDFGVIRPFNFKWCTFAHLHTKHKSRKRAEILPEELDAAAATAFGSWSPTGPLTAADWVRNELYTFKYCFKFKQRYESIFLELVSIFTHAMRTVAFHKKDESEPFLTAKTNCLPFESIKRVHRFFNRENDFR